MHALLTLDGSLARADPRPPRYRIQPPPGCPRRPQGRPNIAATYALAADITTAWDQITGLPWAS
jgi:hypothetical protein